MSWSNVSQLKAERAKSLINVINTFILNNHYGEDIMDQRIRNYWLKFKKIIEDNPSNLLAQTQFVQSIKIYSGQDDYGIGPEALQNQKNPDLYKKVSIDNQKLISIGKDLLKILIQNTKIPLNMFD